MKLKTFDSTNSRKGSQQSEPSVNINPKGGIYFSRGFFEPVGIKKGDAILIHQDTDHLSDWYVEKTTAKKGLIVRDYKGVICIQAAAIVKEILKSTGNPAKIKRFPMKTTPYKFGTHDLYAIVTERNPVNSL